MPGRFALFFLCLSLAAVAWPGQGVGKPGAGSPGAIPLVHGGSLPAPDPAYAHLTPGADYRIGPMDKLAISVFQVDELKTEAQVDSSGNISLPLIGVITAAGKTTAELSGEIAKKLAASYLQSPQVTVLVEQADSQRVTVGGEVKEPGVYDLHGKTTLLQAVALAKGADDIADLSHVTVFRTVNGQRVATTLDLRPVAKGKAADPEVYGNDIVIVGASGFKSAMHNAGAALPWVDLLPLLIH